ncbi:M15 family metallopeptidase [bacterium]|nr:M15 family metallopeptidase [bacterium]
MLRALLLAASVPWSLGAPSSPESAGPTLFPQPVRDGEALRFVVDGAVLAQPDRAADTVAVHEVGAEVVARGEVAIGLARWVAVADVGWVEAARLDRLPDPMRRDPEPGTEGMTGGRVLPWDWRPSDLVALPVPLKVRGYEERVLRMRAEAAAHFKALVASAHDDGVEIAAFSAFRPADYQRRLYARAVAKDPAQRVSAAPGRSEHQLGTTVDVGTPGTPLAAEALAETDAGRWLERYAESFGFVVSFSRERHAARGVAFEPWHLRWVGPHARDDRRW